MMPEFSLYYLASLCVVSVLSEILQHCADDRLSWTKIQQQQQLYVVAVQIFKTRGQHNYAGRIVAYWSFTGRTTYIKPK